MVFFLKICGWGTQMKILVGHFRHVTITLYWVGRYGEYDDLKCIVIINDP